MQGVINQLTNWIKILKATNTIVDVGTSYESLIWWFLCWSMYKFTNWYNMDVHSKISNSTCPLSLSFSFYIYLFVIVSICFYLYHFIFIFFIDKRYINLHGVVGLFEVLSLALYCYRRFHLLDAIKYWFLSLIFLLLIYFHVKKVLT